MVFSSAVCVFFLSFSFYCALWCSVQVIVHVYMYKYIPSSGISSQATGCSNPVSPGYLSSVGSTHPLYTHIHTEEIIIIHTFFNHKRSIYMYILSPLQLYVHTSTLVPTNSNQLRLCCTCICISVHVFHACTVKYMSEHRAPLLV